MGAFKIDGSCTSLSILNDTGKDFQPNRGHHRTELGKSMKYFIGILLYGLIGCAGPSGALGLTGTPGINGP